MYCEGMGTYRAVHINSDLGKRIGCGLGPGPMVSEGLSDGEIAQVLGVRLERFLAVLYEAGLRPRPRSVMPGAARRVSS